MASRVLPGLGLNGFWDQGDPWKTGGDENWLRLSVMTQLVVESATSTLPASPANGVVYIVPQTDAANKGKIAVRDSGSWVYFSPPVGSQAWVKDASKRFEYTIPTGWAEIPRGSSGPSAPVSPVSGTALDIDPTMAGNYLRFTTSGAKVASFNGSTSSYSVDQEFHIANRATTGDISLQASGGIALLAPVGGTLVIEPGGTVTVKFVGASSADVFGSTKVAP